MKGEGGRRKDDAEKGQGMKRELIVQLHAEFEELLWRDEDSGLEYWLARDLQRVLGYKTWENFSKVIEKAGKSCETSGYDRSDHFLDARKMVSIGSGARREVDDIMLSRYLLGGELRCLTLHIHMCDCMCGGSDHGDESEYRRCTYQPGG